MQSIDHAKQELMSRLSDFLGLLVEETGMLLEHLLTIETKEDLYDYLKQLLGSSDESVQVLAEDIASYQNGDFSFVSQTSGAAAHATGPLLLANKGDAAEDAANHTLEMEAVITDERKLHLGVQNASNNDNPPVSTVLAQPEHAPREVRLDRLKEPPTTEKEKNMSPSSVAPPLKGKAKFDCGCYGSVHKPLTNCLYCGRVACEKEGFTFCPFCGYLLEEVKPPPGDISNDKAWAHKERLLKYDREHARRTIVIDDHADYFKADVWMTSSEQDLAAEEEQSRHDALHKKGKMRLQVDM